MARTFIAVLALALAVSPLFDQAAHADSLPGSIRGEHFVDAAGEPVFKLGANYEGPVDHAWQMWEDDNFDLDQISADMARARSANLSVLRIFMQRPLAVDVRAGRWEKLDRVLDLADQHGLKLIVTFADYPEMDVSRLVEIDRLVAERYRGRPTILAYDLKNEPRIWDLSLAIYPPDVNAALQDLSLVEQIGEAVPREDIPEYRTSAAGRRDIPARLSDDQAYVHASVLAAYRRFLDEAAEWARGKPPSSVAYLASPDSSDWDPLKAAVNDTLAAWMKPRLDVLREADPGRPITVGHVDPFLASMAVNDWLDYRTLHRYPGASAAGVASAGRLFEDVRDAVPGRPLVLGEFGFSNATLDDVTSADLELQTVWAVREARGAGALKWMLNDFPHGFNERENNFGMFRADGSPKAVVGAFNELGRVCPLTAGEPRPADYPVEDGHFFTQTNGRPTGTDSCGYSVTNADGIPFWDAFNAYGGVDGVGYPVGRRFVLDGFVVQPMQKAVFQWRPAEGEVWLLNTFDWLHDAGRDDWLEFERLTPRPFDSSPDAGRSWEEILARRVALLDENPAMKERFLSEPEWIDRFGLPVSTADYPEAYVVRAQRATLQQWKSDFPWASAGEITVANGGDIAKEAGLIPPQALALEPAPRS